MADKKEYIERGALLKTPPFTKYGGYLGYAYTEGYLDCAEDARMAVKCAPAADVVEVRHGEWIIKTDDYDNEYMMCSCCKDEFYPVDEDTVDSTPNYCPNCGADMRGIKDGKE